MHRLIPDLLAIIRQSGLLLLNLMPYVLVGALISALLLKWRKFILPFERLKLPKPALILCTALLGTISPLSTIGMAPVVIGLVECGFPIAAGISFLAASSITNPQMLLISFGTIGPTLTVLQWLSGISIGCIAGFLAILCEKRGITFMNKKLEVPEKYAKKKDKENTNFFLNLLDQLGHVLFYMLIGVVAASTLNVWMPESFIFKLFGQAGLFDVTAGAILSVPLYVCGGGVLPMMQILLSKGLSPGIALAFVIMGPATRFQALAALGAFLNKKILVGYILLLLVWAVAVGLLFNTIVSAF